MTKFYLDFNSRAHIFSTTLKSVINKFMVIKTVQSKECEWFTNVL